ncbi:E3 ubiquitin-protein ligase synoviolin A [Diachasma alloeum]|uniref:E3 ubiquitin-protein ligase synoviolin A n=1 Tax=Diachasma alloeum TaxID=454923 RepID=UPI0007384CA9|nr:E3 ubiquitin-protein ligase synoviolin A [Diachasma alloeum]
MRAAVVMLVSVALTCLVIGNAYYQKKQFYPSVVYITKSNPSMAVIYVQGLIIVFMTNTFLRKIFFGNLRAAELEHLVEKAWYAVTETCLAFTVFRDDFSPKFIALFTLLLFLKSFHWLAEDRVDYMERSPVITWLFHLRVATLLILLSFINLTMIEYAYNSTLAKGASVQLVFGFEYAILLTVVLNISVKYILHTIDLQNESPWENKPVLLLYTELVIGLIKVILYVAFVTVMVKLYTLPLFAVRPMYYTMRTFKKAFQDIVMSRRAIRNMNTFYPDATPEELAAADNVCIICREEMVSASKKLPCNHIFHTACLRSWFQRQQTCPTCRLNILRPATPSADNRQQNQGQGTNQIPQQGQAPVNNQDGSRPEPRLIANLRAALDQTAPFPPQGMPFFAPPFPNVVPFPPVPTPPPNLTALSEDELRAMEGNLRQAVEARIETLQRVQLLLDAANAMMNQYQTAAATANIPMPPTTSPPNPQPQSSTAATPPDPPKPPGFVFTFPTVDPVPTSSTANASSTSSGGSEPTPSTSSTLQDQDDEATVLRQRRLQKFTVPTTED